MATTQQSSTKQDILQYLLKHSQATAGQLSEILEVSPQAIRRHLKDLEADDMVVYSIPENSGMGRPQHIYHLSPGGRQYLQRSATKVSGGYGEFAVSLLDTLAETVGREQVKTILQKQWERKAQEYQEKVGQGCLEERVATLVELRKAEGFMAEFRPVEENDDGHEGIMASYLWNTPALFLMLLSLFLVCVDMSWKCLQQYYPIVVCKELTG